MSDYIIRNNYLYRKVEWEIKNTSLFQKIKNQFDKLPSKWVLWSIIGINFGIFLLWNTIGKTFKGNQFLLNNFTISLKNLRERRYWTLITNCFSQSIPTLFFFNMLTLYSLGDTELIYVLGNTRFVMIYLLGGLFSSFSHILCEKYIESSYLNTFYSKNFIYKSFNPIILESSAHGASGCIRALTSFFSMIYPQALISFFFIPIPIPAILVCILEIIWDFWNLMETVPNNSFINSTTISRKFISHAGHLGGTFAGFLFYLFIKKFR